MAEFEVTYSVLMGGVEIGFGASGEWSNVDGAIHAAHTDLQRYEWERSGDMPNPKDIEAVLSGDDSHA